LLNQETNFKDEFKKNTLGIEICNTFCLWKHHLNLLLHAVINLRGVSTNKKYCMFYRHVILQRTFLTHRLSSYVEQQQKYAHITCTTLKHPDFMRPQQCVRKHFPLLSCLSQRKITHYRNIFLNGLLPVEFARNVQVLLVCSGSCIPISLKLSKKYIDMFRAMEVAIYKLDVIYNKRESVYYRRMKHRKVCVKNEALAEFFTHTLRCFIRR
jgi:hypothetical protein